MKRRKFHIVAFERLSNRRVATFTTLRLSNAEVFLEIVFTWCLMQIPKEFYFPQLVVVVQLKQLQTAAVYSK